MRWPWCVALVGCSFTPGQLRDDGGLVEEALVVPDSPPGTCYDRWYDGSIRFGAPVAIGQINSTMYDRDPFLTADELQIFISSGRPGGTKSAVWTAKRTSRTLPFPPAVVATSFDTVEEETKLSLTEDGLLAFLGSTLDTVNEVDVWEASRPSTTDTWSLLGRGHLGAVNTASSDHDPTISADGLRLYLAPNNGTYQYIAVATRGDRSASFGAPIEITQLSSAMGDADPSPTPDERIILFGSSRTTIGPTAPNIWYATRTSSSGTFETPRIVPDINGDLPEGDPHLSADGCRVYFGREVDSLTYNWDIFVATALP